MVGKYVIGEDVLHIRGNMTEENKDKKRKLLRLNVEQAPTKPAAPDGLHHNISQGNRGKGARVTVEVRRGSRVSSDRRPAHPSDKFTDEEQLRRLRAVQQSLRDQEEQQALKMQEALKAKALEEAAGRARILESEAAEETTTSVVAESIEHDVSENTDVPEITREKKYRTDSSNISGTSANHLRRGKNNIVGDPSKGSTLGKRNKSKLSSKLGATEEMRDFSVAEPPHTFMGLKKLSGTRRGDRGKKVKTSPTLIKRCIELTRPLTVQALAEKIAIKASEVIQTLAKLDQVATMQTILEVDTAEYLIDALGHTSVRVGMENMEAVLWDQQSQGPDKERSPVVTVMGHVDHGKTSLLDALRKSSVASKEKGGITQHIGAYQVSVPSGKRITFIDTPGHEAFQLMRARGAAVTDIVVLVVAADDGVKAQTIEAIQHAKTSGVPMIVAINKIDKHGVRPDHVRTELINHGVIVEKMGGDVLDVEVSALTGQNLDQLVETILLQAELMNLRCSPDAKARGVVIEAHMRKGHGHVATVLIQNGTLRKGDIFASGMLSGKVRMMFDESGKAITTAIPSQPVEVLGFSSAPTSGERFMALDSEAQAREFIEWKKMQVHQEAQEVQPSTISSIADLTEYFKTQEIETLPIIIKGDVQGSVEGLQYELNKIKHDEVGVSIVDAAVGPVNESDVMLAKTSKSVLLVFNTTILPDAQKLIDQHGIVVLRHQIIYRAIEEIKEMLVKMLVPEEQEHLLGKAEIIKVFHVKKASSIAGCLVKEGLLRRNEKVKIFRGKHMVFTGDIKSLRHVKNDMKEVKFGYECGMIVEGFDAFEVGDRIECYETRQIARDLEEN